MNKNGIPYEEAAHVVTATGWACKTCSRFFGTDQYTPADGHGAEHMARWCCASSMPCKCGGRIEGGYTICEACRNKQREADWLAKPEIEWDGEFPLAVWDDDRYFFDADALYEYVDDIIEDGGNPLGLKLTTCKRADVRQFEMNDFLCDDLPEDETLDCEEIDKTVNDWIAANQPRLFYPTGERISQASLRAQLPQLFEKAAVIDHE